MERRRGYPLCFSLELTTKDYLRRIVDLCALGIRRRVVEIAAENRLAPIPPSDDRDLHWLLLHVLGGQGCDASDRQSDGAEDVRRRFAASLGVGTDRLVNAARHLLRYRQQLNDPSARRHSHHVMMSAFACGVELLECFGPSAVAALNNLRELAAQYKEHQQFKQLRLDTLGWQGDKAVSPLESDFFLYDDAALTSEVDSDADGVVRLIGDAHSLQDQLQRALEPTDASLTQLSVRLEVYRAALEEAALTRAKERDYETAGQLKRVRHSLELFLARHQLGERLERLREAVTEADALVARLVAQEMVAARREDYLTPRTGAAAVRKLCDSLMQSKAALGRELTSPSRRSLVKPCEVLDGWQLWVTKVAGCSLLGLAKATQHVALLRDAHSLWHPDGDADGATDDLSFEASALRAAGYTASELSDAGYTVEQLKAGGFPAEELRGHGVSALRAATFSLGELKAAGFGLVDLRAAGFPATDLKEVGFKASEFSAAGYQLSQLKAAGFTVPELEGQHNTFALMHAGYGALELVRAGYTPTQFNRSLQEAVSKWMANPTAAEACYGVLSRWDVSQVTCMEALFRNQRGFNEDLSLWDVGQVSSLRSVFQGATSFNQPLNTWDVRQVVDLGSMFHGASSFDQPLDKWDVSQATDMANMFRDAASFNQPLSNWRVGCVVSMSHMFRDAGSFNRSLSTWDVSNVADMSHMFRGATAFNQPLNTWNVSQVVDLNSAFFGATSFNQPLQSWDVSRVVDMSCAFFGASSFNQPLDAWDVSTVTTMHAMFHGATAFNQPLSSWDVSGVVDMGSMFFHAASFQQSLSTWRVREAAKTKDMFLAATSFQASQTPRTVDGKR